jgi:8-oxo-dGTP pyrophosphatase MutT (NUDIX family)
VAGGFTQRAEERAWSGHHLDVVTVEVEAPDGSRFTRELLRTGGAAAVVPVLDDGDTVLVLRQYRASLDDLLLEIPAGMVDEGETPEECARRELVEEVGYAATDLAFLYRARVAAGFSDHVVTTFLATGLTEVGADRQGPEEEAMTVERLSLRDAPRLIAAGELTDSKTITGLLAAREHLGVR